MDKYTAFRRERVMFDPQDENHEVSKWHARGWSAICGEHTFLMTLLQMTTNQRNGRKQVFKGKIHVLIYEVEECLVSKCWFTSWPSIESKVRGWWIMMRSTNCISKITMTLFFWDGSLWWVQISIFFFAKSVATNCNKPLTHFEVNAHNNLYLPFVGCLE